MVLSLDFSILIFYAQGKRITYVNYSRDDVNQGSNIQPKGTSSVKLLQTWKTSGNANTGPEQST